MRNSILGVLGEMISQVLSGEDLDPKQKATRDQFLDKLEVLCLLHNNVAFLSFRKEFFYVYGNAYNLYFNH